MTDIEMRDWVFMCLDGNMRGIGPQVTGIGKIETATQCGVVVTCDDGRHWVIEVKRARAEA